MIGQGKKLTEQNNKLTEAKRLAYESEEVALNIQRELNRNTDTLQRAINKVPISHTFRTKFMVLIDQSHRARTGNVKQFT